MRKDWLTIIAASFVAVATAGTSAFGNPALMAARRTAPATSTPTATAPAATAAQVPHLRPSAQISPAKHPFKYLQASISELPLGSNKTYVGPGTNPVMPPAHHQNDPISLNNPVGAPTPQLFIAAAQICEAKGEVDKARGNYQKALSMWPGQVDVLRAAARMEDRLGQMAVAENLYRQAIAANPQHAGAHNDLGLCLARQSKLEESVQKIEQAIQLQPGKPLYRNNAATVLIEMRQDQRAIAHLAAVHGAADANYNFGQLLVQRGRPADATPYFQAAVQQNPQMQHAHIALAKVNGTPTTTAPESTTTTTTAPQATTSPTTQEDVTAGPKFGAKQAVPQYLPPVARQPGATQQR